MELKGERNLSKSIRSVNKGVRTFQYRSLASFFSFSSLLLLLILQGEKSVEGWSCAGNNSDLIFMYIYHRVTFFSIEKEIIVRSRMWRFCGGVC